MGWNCPNLKQYIDSKHYLSGDIVNEMVSIISNMALRQLLSDIREANIFSIIADEATDISHSEQLHMSIHSVDKSFQINKAPLW